MNSTPASGVFYELDLVVDQTHTKSEDESMIVALFIFISTVFLVICFCHVALLILFSPSFCYVSLYDTLKNKFTKRDDAHPSMQLHPRVDHTEMLEAPCESRDTSTCNHFEKV